MLISCSFKVCFCWARLAGHFALPNTVNATLDSLRPPTFQQLTERGRVLAERRVAESALTNMGHKFTTP